MVHFDVPIVDIRAYTQAGSSSAEREVVARELDQACRHCGFMQIVGHGIPAAVIGGLAGAMDAFFSLPTEVKALYRGDPAVNRAYSPPKSESLSLSLGVDGPDQTSDFFEAFKVGVEASAYPGLDLDFDEYAANCWPELEGFRAGIETYFAAAATVARSLTSVFADALDLPPGFFDAYTDHSIDVLSLNNYALSEQDIDPSDEPRGMGEHTDFGIVTVLWAEQVPGLQVLSPAGQWHDVSPADGALLVNLGDLMTRWTNERWLSTLHRVRPPVVDGRVRRRRSAAFFHDGNRDAVVATLPSCLTADGESLYEPITVSDHIAAKLAGSRLGRNNRAAHREAARLSAARAGADSGAATCG